MANSEKRESKAVSEPSFSPVITIHFHHQNYSVTIECAGDGPVKTVMEGLKRLAAELQNEHLNSLKYQVVVEEPIDFSYRHILENNAIVPE